MRQSWDSDGNFEVILHSKYLSAYFVLLLGVREMIMI